MPITSFITNAPAGNRSDFAGTLGYQFTPTRGIRVTALGRGCTTALSGAYSHRVAIWRVSDSQQQGDTVTITSASPTDANGLPYELLSQAAMLTAGTLYVIGSEEFNTTADANKDAWKDVGAALVSGTDHTSGAGVEFAASRTGSWGMPDTTSTAGGAHVWANFYVADLMPTWNSWRGW